MHSHIERDESNRIISRKPLIVHIREVANAACHFIKELPEAVSRKQEMMQLAYLIGVAHD